MKHLTSTKDIFDFLKGAYNKTPYSHVMDLFRKLNSFHLGLSNPIPQLVNTMTAQQRLETFLMLVQLMPTHPRRFETSRTSGSRL